MKLAFLGNHAVPHSTESHVAEAFESCGVEVARIQEGMKASWVPPLADGADVFLWTKTPSLAKQSGSLEEQAKMLDDIKSRGILTTAYHLDRYWDVGRESEIGSHPWWSSDIVFSADGGNQERFEAAGVNHRFLPAAMRASEVGPGTHQQRYISDVAFVGSGAGYHREWPWRQQLLRGLQVRYRRRFVHWPKGPRKIVRGRDLNDLYATARVVVGDSIFAGRCANYWSDRIYETVGRAGALVHPRIEGLSDHFTEGEHFLGYDAGDLGSVYAAVEELLNDEGLRMKLKDHGPPHVAAHHTYDFRVREFLDSL